MLVNRKVTHALYVRTSDRNASLNNELNVYVSISGQDPISDQKTDTRMSTHGVGDVGAA